MLKILNPVREIGSNMGLLFYSAPGDAFAEKIREKIETELPSKKIEIFCSIEALSLRLQDPKDKPDIAVLNASSREELLELVCLSELLQDIRILLILPDRNPATVARGHKLRPRFISDRENDCGEITIILKRLLAHPGQRQNAEDTTAP